MSSKIAKKENNTVTLNIMVEWDEFEKNIQKAYLKNRKKFNVNGFRKGKVPRQIIEKMYGIEVFYEDAINFVLPDAYDNAVEEHDLEPVDRPSIDFEEIKKGEPVEFIVDVVVKPEVKLNDYKGIEAEKFEYTVTDEDIDNDIKKMQEQNARIIEVEERQVKDGDIVIIDFEGYIDGEQFEGGTAKNHSLTIGSGAFIPGFEEQLIGKNKEDEVDVNVNFPEDYQAEDLAGKEALFKVKIHEIKEKELPELDDEFAKDVSEFDTLAELKEDVKKRLQEQADRKSKTETESSVVKNVVDKVEIDIPKAMVESQVNMEIRELDYRLRMQGLDVEKYLQFTNGSMEDIREKMEPNAKQIVKTELVLEEISKQEGISATDEELNKELEKMAKQYNQELDKFKKNIKEEDLEYIKLGIIKSKTVDFLVENAKFTKADK
ncbi:trigger factor [Abyssisolibacter fermentans]|uniref:trigger factor n=1 Tax=Abyssisolibacter fermentans TaxID=1766203 RepID=UPI000830B31C|nr:trigger factor [Abyssisolibacter fermentans]